MAKTTIISRISLPILLTGMVFLFTACPEDRCDGGIEGLLLDYRGLDGCTWVIELPGGEKLEPANLDQLDFTPTDSLPIHFTFVEAPGMMSICMVGKIVNITCISIRKSEKNEKNTQKAPQAAPTGSINDQPQGVPAYPGLISYKLPDGYVLYIFIRGDERAQKVITLDSLPVVMNEKGYYEYALRDAEDSLVGSGIKARNPQDRSLEEVEFLNSIHKTNTDNTPQ